MSHPHRSPKRFLPPKAWRTRNSIPPATSESLANILRNLYPGSGQKWQWVEPAWARLAYERHWINYTRLQTLREKVPARTVESVLFEANPLFGLLPR